MRTYAPYLAAAVAIAGCRTTPPAPPRVEHDPELAMFEAAVRAPEPTDVVVISLATGPFAAMRRDEEAFAFFSRRADDDPERGLFLALAALFQARMAGQIDLLDRVAWVEDAIDKLDRAVKVDAGLSRIVRGAVLARLPARFGQAQRAVDDLTWALDAPDSYRRRADVPVLLAGALERTAWQGLAYAHRTLGRDAAARDALARSGAASLDDDAPLLATPYTVSARDGFRFGAPRLWRPAPGVYVASNFDFADIAFVVTSAGVVVIDTGTTVPTATAALAAFRAEIGDAPLAAILLTHAHWDHVGGLAAFRTPATTVIAHARFSEELARATSTGGHYRWFFGTGFTGLDPAIAPDRLVAERETLVIGDTTFVLQPVSGGETEDALVVDVPDRGVTFVGDVFMPYLGAPEVGEGSPDALLATIATIAALSPRQLVHGHGPLTDFFRADVIQPLGAALADVRTRVLAGVAAGTPLTEILAATPLPGILRDRPAAAMPFLISWQQFAQRLHRQRTGYWQPDGEGIEVRAPAEWAGALDLLAGGGEEAWAGATRALLARGDHGLAARLADHGLLAHPDSRELAALRLRALDGLRERYQQINPFKFIVYSERAGRPLPAAR